MSASIVAPSLPSEASPTAMKVIIMIHLNNIKPVFTRRPLRVRHFEQYGYIFVCNLVECICALLDSSQNARDQYLPLIENLQDFCWETFLQVKCGAAVHNNENQVFDKELLSIFKKMLISGITYL